MNVTFSIYKRAPSWWDSEVEKNNGLFHSSTKWSAFYEKLGLGRGRYLEVLVDNKRALLLLFTEGVIGGGLLVMMPKVILKILIRFPYVATITMHLQPVIILKELGRNEKEMLEVSKKTLGYILNYAKKNKMNMTASDYICFKNLSSAVTLQKRSPENYELLGTSRLKLISEEENYKKLPPAVRNKIAKAMKSGARIKFLDSSDISLYLQGLQQGWKTNGLAVNSDSFYKEMSILYPDDVKFVVAIYKKTVLAGSGLMLLGNGILEFGIYSTPQRRVLKIPGGDLLKWEIIKFGLAHNYQFLDLNMIGVSQDGVLDEKIENINYYKTKWGGESLYGVRISKLARPLVTVQKIKYKFLGY
ncbi:MAG TPA: peptidoglycan bridge formation glycyltransferase FemA/FemB family protein [Patescibacteria group bacterium]|nr:peptidoglycan bridge formation glycyltransferase FemA/FemB family protein [Patescibacteria group bacterium]